MIDLELASSAGKLFRKPIEAAGYRIVLSSDFDQLAKQAEKFNHDITPHFSPRFNTFFHREAFWLGLFKGNECVGYAAAKLQPVGNEGLMKYAQRYWQRVYREESETKIEFADWQMQRLNIFGNLIYAGAWYVSPDVANSSLGKNLGKYIICYSYMEWRDADYFYIFMNDRDVRTGLAAALELSDQIPNAFQWDSHPSQARSDYWLLGMSDDHFEDWARSQVHSSEQA